VLTWHWVETAPPRAAPLRPAHGVRILPGRGAVRARGPSTRPARITFVVLLAAALALLAYTLAPLFTPILLGAILAALTHPAYASLARRTRRPRLAAASMTAALLLVVVLPVVAIAGLVIREALAALPALGRLLTGLNPHDVAARLAQSHPALARLVPTRLLEGLPDAAQALASVAGWAAERAGGLVGGAATFTTELVIDGFLLFVSAYYLFLDGPGLLRRLVRLVPVEERHGAELYREFRDTVFAVLWGTVAIGVVQAALMAAAFLVTGASRPLLWAAVVFVTSMLPLVGSAIVWIPAGVLTLVSGHTWQGLFVLAWGGAVVSTVDNILRPLLVRGRLRIHPLLVFLSIFGGLATFGGIGFVLGPLVASLCSALVRIWERDFAPPPPEAPAPAPAPQPEGLLPARPAHGRA